jgi:hypothetical protein
MRIRIFIPLIAALTALVPPMNTFEARSQTSPTKPPGLFFVVGSHWQTCGDWKDWSANTKLGYVLGHAEGISHAMSFLTDDAHSFTKIKDVFSSTASLTFGELTKAVDDFCSDYQNVKIPAVNAMMLVCGNIAGFPPYGEKDMRSLRCMAVAGDDRGKISNCSNQP